MNHGLTLPQPEAAYDLAMDLIGTTLEVVVTGVRPESDTEAGPLAAQACRAVAEHVKATRPERLLVHIRLAGRATSTSSYRTAKGLGVFGFERSLRIACVFPDVQTYRVNLLGIRLANHDGWDIAAFTDAAAAREWLHRPPAA